MKVLVDIGEQFNEEFLAGKYILTLEGPVNPGYERPVKGYEPPDRTDEQDERTR